MSARFGWFFAIIGTLTLLWRESCENPAVFCYRIGWGIVEKRKALAAVRSTSQEPASCSTHSDGSSIYSTTSKD